MDYDDKDETVYLWQKFDKIYSSSSEIRLNDMGKCADDKPPNISR